MIIVFGILIPFTKETYEAVEDFKEKKPDSYEWPELKDFYITAIVSVLFFLLEHYFIEIVYPFYYPFCKEKKDLVIREEKTKKGVKNLFRFFYYSSSTIFGYIVLKDTIYLPTTLGGSGSIYNTYVDFPYVTPPPLYRFYFTGTLGYHIGALFHHAIFNN